MRTLTIAGALLLATACDDRQVDVREATSEVQSTSESADAVPAEGAPESTGEGEEAGDGLEVEVLERGTGAVAHAGSTVRVHYEAWLAEAHADQSPPFDSSVSRLVPLELRLAGSSQPSVITGLARGLLGLSAGSHALLRIPSELGWGATGNPAAGVPPDTDLVYEVRVVSVD